MITVKYKSDIYEFETLDLAMAWAKELGEFVTIQFNGNEVVESSGLTASWMVSFRMENLTHGKNVEGSKYLRPLLLKVSGKSL